MRIVLTVSTYCILGRLCSTVGHVGPIMSILYGIHNLSSACIQCKLIETNILESFRRFNIRIDKLENMEVKLRGVSD